MEQIVSYIDSGKPIIALRTANHGFRTPLPYRIEGKQIRWGEDVLGGTFLNHHGRWHADSTRGFFDKDHNDHPILSGVVTSGVTRMSIEPTKREPAYHQTARHCLGPTPNGAANQMMRRTTTWSHYPSLG